MFRKFTALACFSALSLAAAGAGAQQPYGLPGGCCGTGYGYWGQFGIYGGANSLPYFTLFPPVYYSYPVPRSYGYSPFAYSSCVMTPEVTVEALPGKVMSNPHVVPLKQKPVERTAGGPLTIANPFASFNPSPADAVASVE